MLSPTKLCMDWNKTDIAGHNLFLCWVVFLVFDFHDLLPNCLLPYHSFFEFDLVASSSAPFPLPCLLGSPLELDSLAILPWQKYLVKETKQNPGFYYIINVVNSPACVFGNSLEKWTWISTWGSVLCLLWTIDHEFNLYMLFLFCDSHWTIEDSFSHISQKMFHETIDTLRWLLILPRNKFVRYFSFSEINS